jgi:ferredoxin
MGVVVDRLKCTGCGACTFVCPVGVLELEDMKCKVNPGCISCGKCVNACNFMAITLTDEPKKKKGTFTKGPTI